MAQRSVVRSAAVSILGIGGAIAVLSAAAALNKSHTLTLDVVAAAVLGTAALFCAVTLYRRRG
jgi:predicted ABC-type sugar transport system permease subunit